MGHYYFVIVSLQQVPGFDGPMSRATVHSIGGLTHSRFPQIGSSGLSICAAQWLISTHRSLLTQRLIIHPQRHHNQQASLALHTQERCVDEKTKTPQPLSFNILYSLIYHVGSLELRYHCVKMMSSRNIFSKSCRCPADA